MERYLIPFLGGMELGGSECSAVSSMWGVFSAFVGVCLVSVHTHTHTFILLHSKQSIREEKTIKSETLEAWAVSCVGGDYRAVGGAEAPTAPAWCLRALWSSLATRTSSETPDLLLVLRNPEFSALEPHVCVSLLREKRRAWTSQRTWGSWVQKFVHPPPPILQVLLPYRVMK